MAKDFTVTVHDPERASEFATVFGTTTVCIRSPLPSLADLPGRPNALVYELDLAELTDDQRQRLINHIATKFSIPAEEVAAELDVVGMPILAENVAIAIHNPQRWL